MFNLFYGLFWYLVHFDRNYHECCFSVLEHQKRGKSGASGRAFLMETPAPSPWFPTLEPLLDNPCTFPTSSSPSIANPWNKWQPGILFQLHSETSLLSSSWQMGRGSEFNMAIFQLFNTRSFTFSTILRLLQTKAGPLCWGQPSTAAN